MPRLGKNRPQKPVNNFQEVIRHQLLESSFDLIDLRPIPAHKDKKSLIKGLQEMLETTFDSTNLETIEYLIRVRPKTPAELPEFSLDRISISNSDLNSTLSEEQPEKVSADFGEEFSSSFSDENPCGENFSEEIFSKPIEKNEATSPVASKSFQAPSLAQSKASVPTSISTPLAPPSTEQKTTGSEQNEALLPNGKLNVQFLLENARILYKSGDYALARNIYRTLLKGGECSDTAFFEAGRCLEAEGKNESAISHYKESIAYHPSLNCFQQLSSLYIRLGNDQEAADVLERTVLLKEIKVETRFELFKAAGNCWTRVKSNENAERCFKKALEISPAADEVRANLGAVYLQMGKVSGAKRCFTDAIASNPKNHQAWVGLGSCNWAEGDKAAAHDHFSQALSIELNNPNAVFYLVKCAYEIKSYAVAAKFLEDYIQIAPVNPNLLYSLAGLQFHLGRVSEARATTMRVLDLQAHHVGAKDLLQMVEKYTEKNESV